jgi:hypothetical protein
MLSRPVSVIGCLLAIARAAVRVSFHQKRRSLPELVSNLRSTSRTSFCDPLLSLAVLERLLPLLPPYGAGRCVKRSLLLLDLWSRAGLAPSFHLGLLSAGGERFGHAWVTTRERGLETYRPPDVREAFRA